MEKITILLLLLSFGCTNTAQKKINTVLPGAYETSAYVPLLSNKNVGLTVNHSSLIGHTHLTDTLRSLDINIAKVFTPEHGFTGTLSDGEKIEYDSSEAVFELISLYGKNKKPTDDQLDEIDIMVFDIQDVGTRFYTYISTMHYVMEACAENDIPIIILDRPNPNGSYVDGPVLDTAFQSFVGLHPIPIVHGMTVGELAQMINNEGWMENGVKADLQIVKIKNWSHNLPYSLPVSPSPNLPNDLSISLYPSFCLFEGTIMSVGRGTDNPFQQIGHPNYPDTTHTFIPKPNEGAKWPPYEGQKCFGKSWVNQKPNYAFSLQPLINAYKQMEEPNFFNDYFERLAGTNLLQKQIEEGQTEVQIRQSWEPALSNFKENRKQYLLYD